MRILFLGRTQMLMNTIELFQKTEHTIVGIGTCKAAKEYSVTEENFCDKARDLNIPFFCDSRINSTEIHNIILSMRADIAISINWLTIIDKTTIDLFTYGILNGHTGDLPRYRGNACPNWAILNGEEKIGIAVHFMEPNSLDSGDIIVKKYIDVTSETTIGYIYTRIEELFPDMFMQAVYKIMEMGKYAGSTQSKKYDDILRCYPRIPSDSYIDWNKSCIEIDRLIRASGYPFDGAYTYLNGNEKIYILKATVVKYEYPCLVVCGQVVYRDTKENCVGIAAKDGVILISEIADELGEKKEVTQIIKSMRDRLGMVPTEKIYELENEIKEINIRLNNLLRVCGERDY